MLNHERKSNQNNHYLFIYFFWKESLSSGQMKLQNIQWKSKKSSAAAWEQFCQW